MSAYLEELSGGNEDAAYGSHGREHALMLARAFPGYYYRQVKVCDSCYAVYSRIQQAKERADRPRGRGRTRHRRRRRHRGRSGAGSAALSRPPGPGQLRPLTQGPREALARARGSQSLRFRPASLRASARSLPSLSGTGRPVTGASAAVGRGAQWEGDRPGSAFGQGGSEVEGGFDARPPTPSLADDDQTREALLGVSDGVSDGGEGLPQDVADGLDLAGRAMRLIGKSDVAELRSYASPPPSVSLVAAAVTLLATGEPMPWGAAKKLMANGERFLRLLAAVDKDRVPAARLRALVPILHRRAFQPFALEGVSLAAARFCAWVRGVAQYGAWRAGYPARTIAVRCRSPHPTHGLGLGWPSSAHPRSTPAAAAAPSPLRLGFKAASRPSYPPLRAALPGARRRAPTNPKTRGGGRTPARRR